MSNLTNITVGVILVLGFALLLQATVLDPMNDIYGENLSTGINTSSFNTLATSIDTQDSNVIGGEARQTDEGLSLTETWEITKGIYTTITGVVKGEMFDTLFTEMMGLHPAVALIARLILWSLLIFAVVKLFMKVAP